MKDSRENAGWSTLERLRRANPKVRIYSINDSEFQEYGKPLKGYDFKGLAEKAALIPMPSEGSKYELAVGELQSDASGVILKDEIFGESPVQVGYCWGYNDALNGLEYHKSSEINIAVTPMLLILGKLTDIKDGCGYDSSGAAVFYMDKGEAAEIYSTTLHFCPCQAVEGGFGCIVVLPEGTNAPLDGKPADLRLFRKNKWLICHDRNETLIAKGVSPEIHGENIRIEYIK